MIKNYVITAGQTTIPQLAAILNRERLYLRVNFFVRRHDTGLNAKRRSWMERKNTKKII